MRCVVVVVVVSQNMMKIINIVQWFSKFTIKSCCFLADVCANWFTWMIDSSVAQAGVVSLSLSLALY